MNLLFQFGETTDNSKWETVNTDGCKTREDILIKALTPRIDERPTVFWLQIGTFTHKNGLPVCVEKFRLAYP